MKRKGIFGDPLITQTFSAHYSMTSGAKVIPVIGDRDKPFLALALSAAAVQPFGVYTLILMLILL
jgi:hypothetical protein